MPRDQKICTLYSEKCSKFDIFSASPPSFFREPHDQMKIPGQYFDSISRNLPCVVLQCDTHTEGRIRIKTDIRSKYAGLKRDCWGLQGSRIRLVLGCVFSEDLCVIHGGKGIERGSHLRRPSLLHAHGNLWPFYNFLLQLRRMDVCLTVNVSASHRS